MTLGYRSVSQLTAAEIGARVTVRHRLPDGAATDVIGVLEHADEATVAVRDRNGTRHEIGRADVVATRVIGSRPPEMQNPANPAPG